jgi:SRSO17 transposase
VVFLITSQNAKELFSYHNIEYFKIYLPLVNSSKYITYPKNIIFGGIDYKKQFEKLKQIISTNLIEIYDDSSLGELLHSELIAVDGYKNITSLKLVGKNPNYRHFLNKNKILTNSTVILNMPIVKSSILLSQIRANDINVANILTTQINYTPLLLVLTQQKDREHLILSNVIQKLNNKTNALNQIIGNNILSNWVNFSTILGVEYLLYNKKRLFDLVNIQNNQYNIV